MERIQVKTAQLGTNNVLFVIGTETQKPIAIAILDVGIKQIGQLLVDANFKRQGYGTKLIKAIEQYAKEKGISSLQAITHPSNVEARGLFEKLGYEEWIKCYKVLEKE